MSKISTGGNSIMKKLALILGIVTLVAACNTIEEPSNFVDEKVNAPVLFASIEQPTNADEAQTKTYLNSDWLVRWTANDNISAFVNNTSNWKYQFAGNTGDATGSFNSVSVSASGSSLSGIYAIYPYSAANSISTSGVMTVSIPTEQTYAANSFGLGANMMTAVSTSVSDLKFKNVCGYVMFKLYGSNVNVKSVSLKGNNNEKIAGSASISMAIDGEPSVTMLNNATDKIILNCPTAITIGNSAANYTEFWFAVRPVTFTNGFTITVTTDDGKKFTKSTHSSFEVVRSYAKKMAPIQVVPVSAPVNLSANGTANCYIVSEPGEYYFNCTVAGNGQTVDMAAHNYTTHDNVWPKVNGTYSASLPALHSTDIRVTLNQNNCISNVTINPTAGTISFKASGAKGNAKILVMDAVNDDPAWVWHIWCTDQPATVHVADGWSSWGYQMDVMDRNMGAIRVTFDDPTNASNNPDEVCGFYYQGGNPTGWTWAEFSNTVADYWRMVDGIAGAEKYHRPIYGGSDFYWFNPYAATSPEKLFGILWGGGSAANGSLKRGPAAIKTMYDPCPPGYKVMPVDGMGNVVNSDSGDQYGFYKNGTNGAVYFPYNGAAWAGGSFWMKRGYVPDGDTPNYCNLWTSGHNNTNMWYEFQAYAKDVNRGGGGTVTDHILARGMGVRCIADNQE